MRTISYFLKSGWCLINFLLYVLFIVGIIVAGPPGSGKTSVIETVVESLCTSPRGMSRSSMSSKTSTQLEVTHKLLKINPMVVDDLDMMFGYVSQNHDWVDGIVTTACRKANRVSKTFFFFFLNVLFFYYYFFNVFIIIFFYFYFFWLVGWLVCYLNIILASEKCLAHW